MHAMASRSASLFGLLVSLVTLSLAPRPAAAWTPEGHQVMCAIAETLLDDETRRETDRLLAIFQSAEPDLPSSCAWLDMIRSRGVGHFDRWHYINQPINPGGLPVPTPHPDDVIFAIRESMDTLRDPWSTDFGRAFALRVLVHVVGDIHQPLHTVSRYSPRHPEGDRGGNDFAVVTGLQPGGGRSDSLHILWDRGLGLFDSVPQGGDPDAVRKLAEELQNSVPKDDLKDLAEIDPQAWADEGLRLATDYAYRGIEEGDVPSAEYLGRSEPVARRQLVLAAHRLAELLDLLLTPPGP